jgi:hypothetical protein
MKVGLHANHVDRRTSKIGSALSDIFDVLSEKISGDYGGTIEHLWIDFELSEMEARPDGKPKFAFRFAKRVSGRSHFGLPPSPDNFNVGHFSVRPDFRHLLSIQEGEVIPYCLSLIHNDLIVLKAKEKKLGGFNSEIFKNKFADACKSLGYPLK